MTQQFRRHRHDLLGAIPLTDVARVKVTVLSSICFVFFCFSSQAQDVICEVKVNGTGVRIEIPKESSSFAQTSVDFDDGFRFSAQRIKTANQNSKLKSLVYQWSKARYVLIHHAEWEVNPHQCVTKSISFGKHQAYSTKLEMPLEFQCEQVCVNKAAP